MTMNGNDISEKNTAMRNKPFLPSAGALSAEEFKIYSDEDCEGRGLWLDVFCPEDRCLREEERIKLIDFCEDAEEKPDLWLETFCPESSCEIYDAWRLP